MTNELTFEEQRVEAYTLAETPTDASQVTAETPLSELNLNWSEKDLPESQRTRHVNRLHPYLGKYIPQLAEVFLRKYFVMGETVVDPFSGSGTTLVQANELGINALGYDISAFNVLLGRAKLAHYDLPSVKKEILSILTRVREECSSALPFTKEESVNSPSQLSLWEKQSQYSSQNLADLSENDRIYLQTWFAPQALNELSHYRSLIDTEYQYRDILKVILSRSARSARLTTHFDLDFPKKPQTEPYQCYKHSRECRPTTEAFKFLERYSLDTIKRLEQFAAIRTDANAEVYHADSRSVTFDRIDGVVTSPPYVGLIDYHAQHAYAYHLLGLEDRRTEEIGAAAKGNSLRAKKQYQEEIASVFSRLLCAMKTGGRLIVVAADGANLYPEIARIIGVEEEAVVQRHVNRRTGRRAGEFYESVFIWRKP